jgi:hypothetical protein
MKKIYSKPLIEVNEVRFSSALLSGSGDGPTPLPPFPHPAPGRIGDVIE